MDDISVSPCAMDGAPPEVFPSANENDGENAGASAFDDARCESDVDGANDEAPVADFVGTPEQMGRIEALLFASDAPLRAGRLADLVGECTPGQVRRMIEQLNDRYEQVELTFRIVPIARGYQMMTLPDYADVIARMHQKKGETRLGPAAMEALAVVAYRQPVIRADIESIRGVGCGEILNRLCEVGLVKVVGRADVVGRPKLYGTTQKFLDVFGLADIRELPELESAFATVVTKSVAEIEPVEPAPVAELGRVAPPETAAGA